VRDIIRTRSWRQPLGIAALAFQAACSVHGSSDPSAGAPPQAVVDREGDPSLLRVDHPERFRVTTATSRKTAPTLSVTGVVAPDISREVPVVSLASGRVVDLRVRLGDEVKKGQLLMKIRSADVSGALADYRKAQADQKLALAQLERARDLYDRGAVARKDLEVAEDSADKAKVDVENSVERLRLLGVNSDSPLGEQAAIVDIVAPASGVITEQNVTNAAGVRTLDNSPNLFTISDISRVWIVCDVHENDLPSIQVGDGAEIHLAAYPDRTLNGRISNIGPILDPALRTAKVRIEVANPGLLRIGMFVTADFHGQTPSEHTVVPASAILHLHDRDWVYMPAGEDEFRRLEVISGQMLPGNLQEITLGLRPGDRVVGNALVFQSTAEQ
jgi:cobalt-zinc-cadmium efflux system membrane fusion protein